MPNFIRPSLPLTTAIWNVVVGTGIGDLLNGTSGRDLLLGLSGEDTLAGRGDTDILIGGKDDDHLSGGAGNDILVGGTGGDTYEVSTLDGGQDTIIDQGNAPNLSGTIPTNMDEIHLTGFSSVDEAVHSIDIEIVGANLILSYDNTTAETSGQITVRDHFTGPRFAVEQVNFGSGPVYHVSQLSGDQFTYSVHGGPDAGGEDIVLGTNGADEIYSGIGNDIILGGNGADHFMFHNEDAAGGGNDIILDFELGRDVLDFTDIVGLDMTGVSVADNDWGNAVVTTAYGSIELAGIAATDVTGDMFQFA